ncbi:MAG: hypothetical protein ACYC4K_02880 [Thiobacillus sp.]
MAQYPIFPRQGGNNNVLNITAATVVKASPGTIWNVNVTTAGTTVGGVYDYAAASGQGAANLAAAIPNAVGAVDLIFPCKTGILIVPGTGQVVSVSFS